MIERFAQLPTSLKDKARHVRLGPDVPAMIVHPDWERPAPLCLWLHGRTAHKELDPGRYLRWMRAGIATVALDLPGHGERFNERAQTPAGTIDTAEQMLGEIDPVLADPSLPECFDRTRMAIGGMSAGGMVALRRLCDPHSFLCATVEATTGNLHDLYFPEDGPAWSVEHDPERVAAVDPIEHLDAWRPIPVLAVHSRRDELIPWPVQELFLRRLACEYEQHGADPGLIETVVFDQTGAPREHLGFGAHSNDAKNAQVAFLARCLNP